MKKLLSVSLILILFFCSFSGCAVNRDDPPDTESNTNKTNKEKDTSSVLEQQTVDINHIDGYELYAAELVANSKLILVYYNNDNQKYQFRQYDLKSRSFSCESDEYDIPFIDRSSIRFLSENFYILSEGSCYVFDFNCNLIQKLPIPENISETLGAPDYWLSDDLQKVAKVAYINELEKYCLYISDPDGKNEKQVRVLNRDLISVHDLFFSADSNLLGFEGGTIPTGKDTSIDCYGYIDLRNMETTVYPDDDTYIVHQGDMMLICDKVGPSGATRKGIVKTLNLETKEKTEIVMDVAGECEDANFAPSDTSFIVGMHKSEATHTIGFTIYEHGKKINTVDYICPEERMFKYLESGATMVEMDIDTKQIIVLFSGPEYTVLTIPFEK